MLIFVEMGQFLSSDILLFLEEIKQSCYHNVFYVLFVLNGCRHYF